MRSGSKNIAILGMAAAIAGATANAGVVPNLERGKKYYDPAGRRGQVPNKTNRGKRRHTTRRRH